jgi:protein phosphatase
VLDGGRLVVAHAGMKASMQGRGSGAVRDFAMYGETTGETDEFGLPVRLNWAAEYRGRAAVVYGHTPVPDVEWLNNTACVDTGCVFGGKLTALRWPERECVDVPARRTYVEPVRPLNPTRPESVTLQQQDDDVLDLADVRGKRQIDTRLMRLVTIREENATAALEVMSRFAADPRWLIHLPPTMSPGEVVEEGDLLEHPTKAFDYFKQAGVRQVVCQEKHMGSRAILICCRDATTAQSRFGVVGDAPTLGIIYTRTGRPFFDDREIEQALLLRVSLAMERAGLWEALNSEWVCLDCELMPWSAKAQALIRGQYAAVAVAGRVALASAGESLREAAARGVDVSGLLSRTAARHDCVLRYADAYRRYCWPVEGVDGLRIAPFHLLASEGAVHTDRTHRWHMQTLGRLCASGDPVLLATPWREVDLSDETSQAQASDWWTTRTEAGGEGMVVKPVDFICRGPRGLVQPAIKVRGHEYLRIIYGPEYTMPDVLPKLRRRGLATKRSLALREFALGIESLERFVRREPLRRVHECVFGVLALESEPVDPRL